MCERAFAWEKWRMRERKGNEIEDDEMGVLDRNNGPDFVQNGPQLGIEGLLGHH